MNIRNIILDMLGEIIDQGRLSHYVIGSTLDRYSELTKQERSFIKRVCQGVVERKLTIDYILSALSSVRINKIKPIIRNILRMGIYQVIYMDSVPDSAACNEAVKLAKKRGLAGLSGYVNGIMRSCVAKKDVFPDLSSISSEDRKLSIEYSIPEWIISEWRSRYDISQIRDTLEYFFKTDGTGIRCNISRISSEELSDILTRAGIVTERGRYLSRCMRIRGYDSLTAINEFRAGDFCVQDESSALTGIVAGLKKGDRVLDLCAAPGGKTFHAADILKALGGGHVTACDISIQKTDMIRENSLLYGFTDIEIIENDALIYNEKFNEGFDVVIADLPCSGLGIIGRKPDIKYNMSNEKQNELVRLQRDILKNAVRYIRRNGTLIYSTCTINIPENQGNVEYIISELGLKPDSLNPFLPVALHSETTEKGYIQLFPGIHGTDGFFMARFKKN